MITKKQLKTIANSHRVILTFNEKEITAEAPKGYIFKSSSTHEVVASSWDDESFQDIIDKTYEDILGGLEICEEEGCEWCD